MSHGILVALFGLALGAPMAWAQAADPVLQGPKVEETSVPGENRTFGQGAQRRDMEIPHRLFQRALATLRGREAPEALRLTAEQDRALREADLAFRRQQNDYFEQHRAEVRGFAELMGVDLPANTPPARAMELLRNRARGQGTDAPRRPGPDRDSPQMDTMDPAQRDKAAAMSRMRELAEGAPKTRDLHVRVWTVLNDAQKAHVETLLKTYREENMMERRGELGLPAPAAGRPASLPEPQDRITDINDPRLPAPVRERLSNMTPQEQARALERLNQRQLEQSRGTDRQPQREGDRARRPGAKPPPTMDEVSVPQPTEKPK